MQINIKTKLFGFLAIISVDCLAMDCKIYEGTTVSPMKFSSAIKQLKAFPAKDEFETSEQYENKIRNSGQPNLLVIAKKAEKSDLGEDTISYDADKGQLNIQTYAFKNSNEKIWEASLNANPPFQMDMSNRDSIINVSYKDNGSYIGQNSFGAMVKVIKKKRYIQAIVEPVTEGTGLNLFPHQPKYSYGLSKPELDSIPLSPKDAQSIKNARSLAFVVTPKPPYKVKASYLSDEPNIRNPVEIRNEVEILVADFECSFVLDTNNKVIGVYPNR